MLTFNVQAVRCILKNYVQLFLDGKIKLFLDGKIKIFDAVWVRVRLTIDH